MANTMGSLAAILAIQNQQRADQEARNQINQGRDQSLSSLTQFYNTGRNDLQSGRDSALSAINNGETRSLASLSDAFNQSRDILGNSVNDARGYLDRGFNVATDYLNQGVSVNQPWYDSGVSANTMYNNAIGLGGADGNAAAVDAFRAGPGYQWALDQATRTAANKASSLGAAGSGNTLAGITRLGMGLADQEYGNWLGRLAGVSAQGQNAAGNMQSGYTNLANIADASGRTNAQLSTDLGSGLSNLTTNYGTNRANLIDRNAGTVANIYSNAGNAAANLAAGQGTNLANVYTGASNNLANNAINSANSFGNYLTGSAATMDAANNAATNRNSALFGGALSALGSLGGYALAGPMGGLLGNKLFGTAADAVARR